MSAPKATAQEAWAVYGATGSVASAAEFFDRVSAWVQGTAAQLLRPHWPVGADRPSSTQVEGRLRHALDVAAHTGDDANYVDALDAAQRTVRQELRGARRVPSP